MSVDGERANNENDMVRWMLFQNQYNFDRTFSIEYAYTIYHSQDIGDDANGPHVTRFGVLSIEYFRCYIVGSADLGLHHTPIGIVVP